MNYKLTSDVITFDKKEITNKSILPLNFPSIFRKEYFLLFNDCSSIDGCHSTQHINHMVLQREKFK